MSTELTRPADVVFGEGCVTLEEIRWHASRDKQLNNVKRALETNTWPGNTKPFKAFKHELYEMDGILTRTSEAVIPVSLRLKTLAMAHKGHPGGDATSILRGKCLRKQKIG